MSAIRFNQEQLAERWIISPKTLERWRVLGIGPCYLKLHGKIVYRIEDVEAFELQSLRRSTQDTGPAGGVA